MWSKGNIPGVTPVISPRPVILPAAVRWARRDTVALAIVAGFALFTRFLGLTQPTAGGTPIFDEKHYVPQAWDVVRSAGNPLSLIHI